MSPIYLVFLLIFVNYTHQISHNSESNYLRNSVPLNFQEAVQHLNYKLKQTKFLNDNYELKNLFNYEKWIDFKSQIDYLDDKYIFKNITKGCYQKINVFLKELKLKKEWTYRGIFGCF